MLDCNFCRYLSITEREQNKKKFDSGHIESHRCKKFKKKLLHGDRHPEINPCHECGGSKFIPKSPHILRQLFYH